jgi:NAD(P)-dependent dehydrogenase (short-subunit alcohol dehydrogenase family)
MKELSGRVGIVTGAASGLGQAIARRFAEAGALVVIADVNDAAGQATAAEIGTGAVFRHTDVAEPDEVRSLVEFAVDALGGLDVMVNNAGVSGNMHQRFFDEDFADFSHVLSVNLLGTMVGTQAAGRHMAEHGGGSIINVTSIGGITAGRSVISYRASIDLAEHGVRVNCIAPGNIPTGLLASSMSTADGSGNGQVAMIRAIQAVSKPLRREGAADDVAEAALYLAGEKSAYITGIVLPVDGGTTAGTPFSSADLAKIAAVDQSGHG